MLPTLVFLTSLLKTSRVSRSKRLWFVNIQLQPEVREVQPLRKHLKKRNLGLTRKEVLLSLEVSLFLTIYHTLVF